ALYGIFLMGGFLHRDGRLIGMTRRRWLFAMLALGGAAAAWCTTQSIPDHVVNNSHIAHLLVGGAWLSAFFVARPWIERLATARAGAAFLSWINKRTITIYLWHSTAVVVSFELLRAAAPQWTFGTWSVALLAMTACVTLVFVLVFGWVEDFANRRPRRLWAGSSSSTRGSTAPATPTSPARRWHMPRPAMAAAVLGSLVLVAAADPGAFLGPAAATTTTAAGAQAAGTGGATTTAAPSTTAAAGTAVLGTTASRGSTLRIPSQQPKAPTFTAAASSASSSLTNANTHTATSTPTPYASIGSTTVTTVPTSSDAPWLTSGSDVTDPTVAARLQAAVRQWMTDNAVPGAEVAIFRPGSVDWETAIGTDPANGDQTVSVGTSFDIASVTKTFTAALVWQLADQGRINVDEPIGTLTEVPDFPYTELTVRQLLSHTSGLVNFRDTPEFAADPNSIDTPQAALEAAGGQPLQFTPGTQSFYSTTNYLVLGFLLEQFTGETFDSLVAGLANDAGIGPIPHAPATGGYPNFSVAGLEMTAGQLAHWGVALLGANTPGLSESARQAMANINPSSALGAGLWGYCPCTMVDGQPQWAAIGHSGSTTELQYSPATDIAIVVNLTDSIWAPDTRQDAVIALVAQLRAIALGEA
ncbi:MAG: D-alanyl-D-alanine carboxypeptidase, partial [Acidimicrobiia bacterium]|nr:D-alanyl-D-alanine carboxypeptidase [Acidimicrobiia bacterium]